MRALGRLLIVIAAAAGSLIGSQFPEFAQQYRQRLGGALEELQAIVAAFDADAGRNRLTRDAALDTYDRAGEPFLRDRGASVRGTLSRYERLAAQKQRIETAPPLMRPVVMLSNPDDRVTRGAWGDFEPAVPLNAAGFIWAGLGFVLFGGIVSLLRQVIGIARRRGRRAEARSRLAPSQVQ